MKKLLLGFLLLSLPFTATAQDSHYWTNQFGTRSSLLGGAVVGGVRDTSATFYNPGALGFIDNASLSVSANALKASTFDIKDGAGDGKDLDSSDINVVPLLVSGILKIDGSPEHTLGYSLLTKDHSSIKASARRDDVIDVLKNPFNPGDEDYIGQYNFDESLNEYWAGLSYAYKASDTVSLGLTNFFALRNQEVLQLFNARAVNRGNFTTVNTGLYDSLATVDYTDLRLLWKAGAAVDLNPVKLGLTITTPSVNLYGDATAGVDVTAANLDVNGDGSLVSFVGDDRQDGLDAEYKNPLSIALGAEYELAPKTKLSGTVEWFDNLSSYGIVEANSRALVRPEGVFPEFDSKNILSISGQAESVTNFALGFETPVSEKITGILSFRTDQNAVGDAGFGFSDFDLKHATLGGVYKGEHSDFALGFQYSWGNNDHFGKLVNFSDPSEQNLLAGSEGDAKAEYEALSIIFGYTYYFS